MPVQIAYARRPLARKPVAARLNRLGENQFEGYASLFNTIDGAGDSVAPGAFASSLRKRGAGGIRMLYQHFAHAPIGVWDEIREDARGLYVRGTLVGDVPQARDVAALLRAGALNGLSIGFRTVRAKRGAGAVKRSLLDLELWEISVVTFPLLAGSQVTAIGGNENEDGLAQVMRNAARLFNAA